MRVVLTEFEGILIIEPEYFQDHRGFFFESYSKRRFAEHGLEHAFVQDNHSRSPGGVLRGLHYQNAAAPQFRLIRCTLGEIWDVAVDLRVGSPTFGKWFGVELSAENKRQVLLPPEFAHGFVVLSEFAEVQYKCTGHHEPSAEASLAWDDPDVRIPWPISNPILSDRDRNTGTSLKEYLKNPAFTYTPPSRKRTEARFGTFAQA
ncbi:dTDP-4-dehydrorhamnose 3,5-epimerase [Geobacter sp. SVR]|uniref:dTDP-4-dehydrorhamnose 3,5-epimerase n=1 Tax=Geobacter sp. SVR TaxID=2495594 RepID=UPI0015640521